MECAAIVDLLRLQALVEPQTAATAKALSVRMGLHAEQDVPLKPRTRTTTSYEDEHEDEHEHPTVCGAALRRANSPELLIPDFHEESSLLRPLCRSRQGSCVAVVSRHVPAEPRIHDA